MCDNPLLYFRGRVALYHLLRLLGIGKGDEVLLQAFTCVAVPEAILAVGAKPVWVDLGEGSVTADPADLRAKISPCTKAIVVQHTFGIPADVDAIFSICKASNLPLIEDCCHAFATTHRERRLGTLGDGAFWSYEWGKPVIAGIGGGLFCRDHVLMDRARAEYTERFVRPSPRRELTVAAQYFMHGLLYGPRRFWTVRRAFRFFSRAGVAASNYNPVGTDAGVAADFGWRACSFSRHRFPRARRRASAFLERRKAQAAVYSHGLRDVVAFPTVPTGSNVVYSRFPILVPNKDALLASASAANLELAAWFSTPVHPLAGDDLRLVHYREGSCPRAEEAARTLVSLPLGPKVNESFQLELIELIRAHSA